MTLRRLFALLAAFPLIGYSASPRQKYGTEPAAQSLFIRNHISTPCDPVTRTGIRTVLMGGPAHNIHRTDRMDFSPAELPVFTMHLERSIFEVTGDNSNNYSVQLCAEAGANSENDAQALMKKIKLTRDGKMFALSMPQYEPDKSSLAFAQLQAPPETLITVNGEYSAIRVIGMDAAIKLSTTHARITLLDTTGDVRANAESGVIDFSGQRGSVHLEADWDINLNFTAQHFDGSLDAMAAQPIRVLLPRGFESAFEAIVQYKSDFVCRADICDRVKVHKKDGKFVFAYGSANPSLHFTSRVGPVLVDNAPI